MSEEGLSDRAPHMLGRSGVVGTRGLPCLGAPAPEPAACAALLPLLGSLRPTFQLVFGASGMLGVYTVRDETCHVG